MKPTHAISRCTALALAVFVAATAEANPAPNQSPPDNDPVPLIVIEDVPLADAVKNLARHSGINFILDPRVTTRPLDPISFRWTNTSTPAALRQVLKARQLTMVTNPVTSVARIAPAGLGVKPVPASQVGTNAGAVIPLLVMDDVLLTEAITKLAGAAQLKVSLDSKWAASSDKTGVLVSFRWEKITARQALAGLVDNYELILIEDPTAASARISLKAQVGTGSGRKPDPEREQP